jgi:hypothetical protein
MIGRVLRKTQTGHGVADHIEHTLAFDKTVNREQVVQWLEEYKWLGYHPAGYGPYWLYALTNEPDSHKIGQTEVRLNNPAKYSRWIYKHYASCD